MIHEIESDRPTNSPVPVGAIASTIFLRCGNQFLICNSLANALHFACKFLERIPVEEIKGAIDHPATLEEIREIFPEAGNW